MRSTLKCDIIWHIKWGNCFMKTKIIYISGNEVFDMADIRAAFEEVRLALNLDKTTVLFGVPVDADDAGLMTEEHPQTATAEPVIDNIEKEEIKEQISEEIIQTPINEPVSEEIIEEDLTEKPIIESQPKRRGRPKKEVVEQENTVDSEQQEKTEDIDEKIVPILSILSTNDKIEEQETISETEDEKTDDEIVAEPIDEPAEDIVDEDEADLEKLLSAMTPLQEDVLEDKKTLEPVIETIEEQEDLSVDATLEQLATEFAETQDKIATENKSASRGKIGKLRNILPFKQSKHKDQGLGDLFGWAGIAANDEDFSVPGFFTNAASKK